MPETVGLLLMRATKLPHGAACDPEILINYLNARTQRMLRHHPWTRLNVNSQLVVPAAYLEGTIAITNGLTALVGTGTTWTTGMTGRRIRIANGPELYTFTFLTTTTGTIDRAYEGETETAASFRIWQAIFELPSAVDFFQSIEVPRLGLDLDQKSQEYLDSIDPGRKQDTGGPWCFAPYQDAANGNSRIELYPGADVAESLPIRYRQTLARFVYPDDTGDEFPQWVDADVIFMGIEADLYAMQGDGGMKQVKEADWEKGLAEMVRQDNQRIAPQVMRMSDRLTLHRRERAMGGDALRQSRLNRM